MAKPSDCLSRVTSARVSIRSAVRPASPSIIGAMLKQPAWAAPILFRVGMGGRRSRTSSVRLRGGGIQAQPSMRQSGAATAHAAAGKAQARFEESPPVVRLAEVAPGVEHLQARRAPGRRSSQRRRDGSSAADCRRKVRAARGRRQARASAKPRQAPVRHPDSSSTGRCGDTPAPRRSGHAGSAPSPRRGRRALRRQARRRSAGSRNTALVSRSRRSSRLPNGWPVSWAIRRSWGIT